MRLTKPVAISVLVATFVPLVYMLFFMGTIVVAVLSNPPSAPGHALFKVIFVLHMLCILWLWGLIAFYLVYLFKSEVIPKDQRPLWAVVLIFFNVFSMLVFWFLYIWPESRQSGVTTSDQ